jgi:hypothetical protein
MFDFTAENSRNEGDFPKLSTGEFPVFSGPVDLLNRSGRTDSSADSYVICKYQQQNSCESYF